MNETGSRMTRGRHGVMGYLCALAIILYIDRICIGQAGTAMKAEFGLTNIQWALVGIAFQVAYGVFEPITGHWGDRYGSRRVLIRIVLWWSAFTALTGCVFNFSFELLPGIVLNGFLVLLVVRFLFGAGEAGALPNSARVIVRWFPPGRRGPPLALFTTCAQMGGAIAPALAAALIASPHVGWRWTFIIFGGLGVVWAWSFARWFHDDPASHPAVNGAEREYIRGGASATPLVECVSWRLVLSRRNVWLLGLVNGCASFYSYMLFLWFPTYLKEGRALDEIASGRLGSLPYLFGAVGGLVGGFVGDWLTARTGSRRRALGGMGLAGLMLAGVFVGLSPHADTPVLAVFLCSLGYFFLCAQLAGWWAAVGDVGGRHLGAVFGVCNMIALTGGAVSQLFLGWYADFMRNLGYTGRAQWDSALYVYAGVLMVGGMLWPLIDPRRTVVPEKPF